MRSPWRTWTSTRRLAVGRRREDLLLLRRDGRVARDHHRHHAAERLDAERERRHVEEDHVLHVAGEHAGLHRRADGDDLVRVHALVRLLAEELLHRLLHERDARRAADEDDLVDVASAVFFASASAFCTGSIERSTSGAIICSSFARVSCFWRCFGPLGVGREERQVDGRLLHRSRARSSPSPPASLRRWRTILSLPTSMPVSFLNSAISQSMIEVVDVVAAEVRVAVGRDDLHDVVADLEDRDVERAAAEVVDGDDLVLLLVEAVGERRRGRLVDDALDLEAGDACRRPWWPGAARR